ncbi:MAG: VWA domain-containing protein [Muribaculaceae bacterium]|nr:VWA domain-containing protein [Muribaculaceae bacterium]MDE6332409.1 VWA domain-containing protein [Muribaculaceae bacterium]
MFDFANPILLCLLASVAVFAALYALSRSARRRKLRRFGKPEVIAPLMPDASRYKPAIKITLELLALAAIVMVLARPRAGERDTSDVARGIEVMIAFDVSNSMYASSTDSPDGTSRLDRARITLERLVDRLGGDKVGLVAFAGQPKRLLPLTTDYYLTKMFIGDLNPSMFSDQGTSIADALSMCAQSFSGNGEAPRAIVLLTDVEDLEDPQAVIQTARDIAADTIQINVIGMGTEKPMPVPMPSGGMLEYDGQTVTTALNVDLAKSIAKAGKGIYVNGASTKALDDLADQLKVLGTTDFGKVTYKTSAEQFPTFAWIALILLIIDLFVLDRKIGWLKRVNFFTKPNKPAPKAEAESSAKK